MNYIHNALIMTHTEIHVSLVIVEGDLWTNVLRTPSYTSPPPPPSLDLLPVWSLHLPGPRPPLHSPPHLQMVPARYIADSNLEHIKGILQYITSVGGCVPSSGSCSSPTSLVCVGSNCPCSSLHNNINTIDNY